MAPRRRPGRTVFTGLWLVLWTAAIILALYAILRSVRAGEYAPVPILLIWIAGALYGLRRVGLRFAEAMSGERLAPVRRRRAHRWKDDMPG